MGMNGSFSGSPDPSSIRPLIGDMIRWLARQIDGGIDEIPPRPGKRPEDLLVRPGMAPRLPGETQEAYVERLHRSNEAVLLIMTRSALAMEYTSGRDERIAALRFRQIVGLEAAAASIIVGLFLLVPEMPLFMRAAILVLTPIALVRGGLWFLHRASRMANALARHAERWGR